MVDFQAEVKAFQDALPNLLIKHDGKYVVIHGSAVQPLVFGSSDEALDWGYTHFGMERFFVKQVADSSHALNYRRGHHIP